MSRQDGGRHLSPSENVTDWDLQLHYHHNLQSGDNVVGARDVQKVVLPLEKGEYLRGFSNKEENSFGIAKEEARSPPEKQLFVEYEPGKPRRDSISTASQEFAFEEARTSLEHEALVLLDTGDEVSFPIQDLNGVFPGASWTSSSGIGEGSVPGARSDGSAEPFLVGTSAWHANNELNPVFCLQEIKTVGRELQSSLGISIIGENR